MPVNPLTLPAKPSGYLSLSVAGAADVYLTSVQARCKVLYFEGELTGNITVHTPLGEEEAGSDYLVENATTGSFTLTLKGNHGVGLVITQATRMLAVWTGLELVDWLA